MSSEWQDNGGSSFAVLPWHNLVILCKFFPHFPRFLFARTTETADTH